MLGYAPDKWGALAERFSQKLLIEAGLLVSKDDGQAYDRFRGRIMFPIRDKRARIIGFGGRVLDDSLPKYLNSPETSLFHKGKEVYGLYELLKKNPKPQRILIVEGYMDVIALAQFGIDYAVAALGTAASQAHLDLLFRFSSELVFCFDGDRAGREAAWRVMESAFSTLKDGRSCRIMMLPQSHDPDSLVREEGWISLPSVCRLLRRCQIIFLSMFRKGESVRNGGADAIDRQGQAIFGKIAGRRIQGNDVCAS